MGVTPKQRQKDMKKLVNTKEITATEITAVKAQVEQLMKRSGYSFIFNNEEEIEKFYREEFETNSPIKNELVQEFVIDGEESEPVNGCTTQGQVEVRIMAYYPDGGMDETDYSYIVEVSEY